MARTEFMENGAAAGEARGAPEESVAQKLEGAFHAREATEEGAGELGDAAVDEHFLESAPVLPDEDFGNLEREVSRTRVIFVRGAAAISITAIISVGGALLFHFLVAGGFLLAFFLTGTKPGGAGDGEVGSLGGGSNGGSVIVGEGPQGPAQIATDVSVLLNRGVAPAMPDRPALPEVAPSSSDPRQLAAAVLQGPEPVMIGISSGDTDIGSPRPAREPRRVPPRQTPPQIPPNKTLVVTPPPREVQPADDTGPTILASAGSKAQARSSPNGGMNAGGDDDPWGSEMIIPGAKGDPGSGGNGSGNGGGINRGGSGANNPEPAILEWDMPNFSDAVNLNPPARSTKCKVLVLANGHAGKVDIVQSCGQPALDQKWVDSLMKAKYRPAYRDGKPYDADKDLKLKIGNP